MSAYNFPELFAEAERHDDYWVAGVSLAFTEALVREMERQKVSRAELARRIGATPAYVTKILRGKVNFTLATMVRLARALGSELEVRLTTGSKKTSTRRAGSTKFAGDQS
jgi:transcriptional regulator with XRE-family HTH domain